MNSEIDSIGNTASAQLGKFSSNKYLEGSREFLNSNSLISKFAFLLLVVVIFVLLLRLGAGLMAWIMDPSTEPIIINGTHDAKVGMTIEQDPNVDDSIPILRSVNDETGLEFTWSTWLFIKSDNFKKNNRKDDDTIPKQPSVNLGGTSTPNPTVLSSTTTPPPMILDVTTSAPNQDSFSNKYSFNVQENFEGSMTTNYKHIFHKGNYNFDEKTGLNTPNNAPGMYLSNEDNSILVLMNTHKNPTMSTRDKKSTVGENIPESIIIEDIPLEKWINVVIRISNQKQLDVYINGTLVKRQIMKGVPRQNYGDVYVTRNGGFEGYISSLRYFNTAIGTNKIQDIVDAGPNMKMLQGHSIFDSLPYYLSTRWFFSGVSNMYNP